MEVEPNVVIGGTLLSACRTYRNVELAELSGEKLLQLEPGNSGNYVLLSNTCVCSGRWQEPLKLRNLMKDKRVQKIAAYGWIEVDDMVHKFLVGNTSRPRSDEVYDVVDGLGLQWFGYSTNVVILTDWGLWGCFSHPFTSYDPPALISSWEFSLILHKTPYELKGTSFLRG